MAGSGMFCSIHMFITSSLWPYCQSEEEMKKRGEGEGREKSTPDISEKIEAEMMWLFSHVAAETGGEKAARHNTYSY